MKNHVKRLHLGEELKKTAYQINKPLEMLQVTFSENGTKIADSHLGQKPSIFAKSHFGKSHFGLSHLKSSQLGQPHLGQFHLLSLSQLRQFYLIM